MADSVVPAGYEPVDFSQLPPAEQEAWKTFMATKSSPEEAPAAPEGYAEVSPADVSEDDLYEAAISGGFDPVRYAVENKGIALAPETLSKLAKVRERVRQRGFEISDISFDSFFSGIGHMAKGAAQYAVAAAEALPPARMAAQAAQAVSEKMLGRTVEQAVPELEKGGVLEKTTGAVLSHIRDVAEGKPAVEQAAATELAQTGVARTIKTAIQKATDLAGESKFAAAMMPAAKVLHTLTKMPEEAKAKSRFLDEMGWQEQDAAIAQGKGEIVSLLYEDRIEDLKKEGIEIDPEAVASMTAGDPLTFVEFGGAFSVIGKGGQLLAKAASASKAAQAVRLLRAQQGFLAKAETRLAGTQTAENAARVAEARAAVQETTTGLGPAAKTYQAVTGAGAAAERAAEVAVGAGLSMVGALPRAAGAVMSWTGRHAPTLGLVGGLVKGGPVGALAGLAAGERLAGSIIRGGARLSARGTAARQIGSELMAGGPVSTAGAQAVKDVARGIVPLAGGAAKGFSMDVGLMAATSTSPEETVNMPLLGTAFGAFAGAKTAGRYFYQGQLIAPRKWGDAAVHSQRPYGSFPAFDTAHAAAQQVSSPGVQTRLGSLRDFFRDLGVQVYHFADRETATRVLTEQFVAQGVDPVQAAANAEAYSRHNGFATEFVDSQGTRRPVAVVLDPASAPHEAFHPVQDLLGEPANLLLDRLIFQEYGANWDAHGTAYARRLVGADALQSYASIGENWQHAILDTGNNGNAAAVRKIAEQLFNGAREQGSPISAAEAEQIATRTVAQSRSQADTPHQAWRDFLSPEETDAAASRYLAREVAAENFDAIFKHSGPGLPKGDALTEKLARVMTGIVESMGKDPFRGVQSEGLGLPVKKQVTDVLRGVVPEVAAPATPAPGAPRPTVAPRGTAAPVGPETLAQNQAAAQQTARQSNDARMQALVQDIVNSQTADSPVRLVYRSVRGAPGGQPDQFRTGRRSEQEAAYIAEAMGAMPADTRQRLQKVHAHVRFEQVRDGTELQSIGYSMEKLVGNVQRTARAVQRIGSPELAALVPYEIDTVNGTLTARGWNDFVSDVDVYTSNQQAGGTGAGRELALPPNAGALNIAVPAARPQALRPLAQNKADFINTMMGFKLPETTRISRAGGVPGNVVGQLISEANQAPFIQPRVGEPALPRSPQEFRGFPGRTIQEVNPLRREMEARGLPVNELVEVVERVNLKNLESATAAPEVGFRAGVTDIIRAGFLPEDGWAPEEVALRARYEERPIYAGEVSGLRPVSFSPEAPGSKITRPDETYGKAAARGKEDKNVWVRQSEAPDNSNRVLLVQFTSELMYATEAEAKTAKSKADAYYDTLYGGARRGYERAPDFWEIPKWQAVATHSLGAAADSYVVRNTAEAKAFLKEAGYGTVAFSVLDANKARVMELARETSGKVALGGYTDLEAVAREIPNATAFQDMKSFVESMGMKYQSGDDYRLFRGTSVIPRLALSDGCRHRCKFCIVERKVTETPAETVTAQVDSFKDLNGKIVYLNDKTFGQASNFERLPELAARMREQNPEFEGFVVQTTAAQMKSFTPEFLKNSGIRYVEIGVESFNDPILKATRKPASEKLIEEAVAKLRDAGIAVIPNIIIGMPGETAQTYARTMEFLRRNKDAISHVNAYNIAIYENAELAKEVKTRSAADADENVAFKSFYEDQKIHEDFANEIYNYGTEQLGKSPYAEKGGSFLPQDEITGRQWAEMPDVEWKKWLQVETPLGKSLTGLAYDIGSRMTAERLPEFQEGIKTLKAKSSEALAADDFDTAMQLASRAQFLNEATEAAVGGPKLGFLRSRLGADYQPPLAEMAAMPREKAPRATKVTKATKATKATEDKGPLPLPGKYEFWLRPDGTVIQESAQTHYSMAEAEAKRAKISLEDLDTEDPMSDLYERMFDKGYVRGAQVGATSVYFEGPSSLTSAQRKTAEAVTYQTKRSGRWHASNEYFGYSGAPDDAAPFEFQPTAEEWEATMEKRRAARASTTGDAASPFLAAAAAGEAQLAPRKKLKDSVGGELRLLHYGASGLETIDPAKMGKGAATAIDMAGAPKTFFFVEGSKVQADAPLMSRPLYGVRVSGDAIYDMNSDPLNVMSMPNRYKRDQLLKEEGYSGFQIDTYDGRKVAALYYPVTPTPIEKGRSTTRATAAKGAQFQPTESPELEDTLEAIRAGRSFGVTLNGTGATFNADGKPLVAVTLASANIPKSELTPGAIQKFLAPYGDLLDDPSVKAGVFSMPNAAGGVPTASLDLNVIVPSRFKDLAADFAKKNDQVSIWDFEKGEEIKTGGRGNTVLKTPDELEMAMDSLLSGKAVDVTAIKAGAKPARAEELFFPSLDMGKEFRQKEVSSLTRRELKDRFPEAIIPRDRTRTISSDITTSPLALKAGDKAVEAFADKLAEFYNQVKDSPEASAGKTWYSGFVPRLKKAFGKDAGVFAEFLAATSPQTDPKTNFGYAFDAFKSYKEGRFDKMVTKYLDGVSKLGTGALAKLYQRDAAAGLVKTPVANPSEATYISHWIFKNNLIPRSSTGKRYGMHSGAVLRVAARTWLAENAGPKTANFVKNLTGEGHDATIDLWADRTMRRLGYADSQPRWRILPENQLGVSDADFAFSQAAFRQAAQKLGMQADDLQGALWFAEKKLWSDSGWGRLDLGDYRSELQNLALYESGFSQHTKEAQRASRIKPRETGDLFGLDIQPRK